MLLIWFPSHRVCSRRSGVREADGIDWLRRFENTSPVDQPQRVSPDLDPPLAAHFVDGLLQFRLKQPA
jgi:hypothetical protein